MTEKPMTYSITLRVRRVTCEDAYVAVPVTSAIMKVNKDGTGSIDMEAFTAEAIRISKDDKVEWKVEETHTEPHPIQGPIPENRSLLDAFDSDDKRSR